MEKKMKMNIFIAIAGVISIIALIAVATYFIPEPKFSGLKLYINEPWAYVKDSNGNILYIVLSDDLKNANEWIHNHSLEG